MKKWLALGLAAMGAASVAFAQSAADPDPNAYLKNAIAQLKSSHVNRDKVDWGKLEAEALVKAAKARTTSGTYPAIRQVIAALGEKHTTLDEPRPPRDPNAPKPAPQQRPQPEARLIAGAFGYLKVTQFAGSRDAGIPYAALLRDGIKRLDVAGACGWIVDVRGNSGGNVWPMIDGVGALMGEAPFLTFDVPGQGQFKVLYKDGVAYQEGGEAPYKAADFKPLSNPTAPVAILMDSQTASSAEALVVAFAGRPNVRTFGAATADYITVNNPVRLSDGAYINMTVGWNMDRTGRRYEHAIEPDEATGAEAALDAAANWLKNEPQCALRK